MSIFLLSVSAVKVSEKSLIRDSLPDGYAVSGNGPLYRIIALGAAGVNCAVASFDSGRIVFNFEEEGYPGFWGNRLKSELLMKYPSENPERIV
ncbi:MAG: hypothetical protein UW41_C0030G0003 [Candidatus Collierbacteria bacterium GW2011_GWC2_44_18]|uniref:Uncharacterized protein n=1 Tax=Candidatus Collierbacteria bacterium GW2011_GWC2_44_18 TaxID=1618392 RepID=A0A0G1HMH4_9BACT|nr:MAG: hypothetical protein UW16_C0037G0007 [Microgenomates group bacterium GW2011_GWC1_44_10]KKT48406.1 MAG: hypothetical protein UW41_C0030G0003 [Candidatus Collierbacteria bacterium GW2011_GWC2_44_18]